jgi:hypothetical protein
MRFPRLADWHGLAPHQRIDGNHAVAIRQYDQRVDLDLVELVPARRERARETQRRAS